MLHRLWFSICNSTVLRTWGNTIFFSQFFGRKEIGDEQNIGGDFYLGEAEFPVQNLLFHCLFSQALLDLLCDVGTDFCNTLMDSGCDLANQN